MKYRSTRGETNPRDFVGVLLAGLAEDGGLYMPECWPHLTAADLRAMRGLPYAEVTARVLAPFIAGSIPFASLQRLCNDAYGDFGHPAVVPVVQLGTGLFVQELFHGRTLAFKDLAMQLLSRLLDYVLTERGGHLTIVGATSGDTGSAAIEAFRHCSSINVVVLHPHGRTSEVQRRQMTTVHSANVANIAVEGTFDDCQDLVKGMFADVAFRRELRISAINSINWARIAAQIPYYIAAALALGAPDREVSFSVPSGNFGNVFAAWAARRMGLPVSRLIVAANHNDILARFLASNDMSIRGVEPSLSPSMDIQVSSNFERLLYELVDHDAVLTARTMMDFRQTGRMQVGHKAWQRATHIFHGFALDDAGTIEEIRDLNRQCGYLADPHTAIGIAGAKACACPGVPTVAMATAHPAKFPDVIERAIGVRPSLPPRLADLYERDEHYVTAPNDLAAIESLVRAATMRNAA